MMDMKCIEAYVASIVLALLSLSPSFIRVGRGRLFPSGFATEDGLVDSRGFLIVVVAAAVLGYMYGPELVRLVIRGVVKAMSWMKHSAKKLGQKKDVVLKSVSDGAGYAAGVSASAVDSVVGGGRKVAKVVASAMPKPKPKALLSATKDLAAAAFGGGDDDDKETGDSKDVGEAATGGVQGERYVRKYNILSSAQDGRLAGLTRTRLASQRSGMISRRSTGAGAADAASRQA